MITSAKNAKWEGDVEIEVFVKCGLPVTSIIRASKNATIDADLVLGRLGYLSSPTVTGVQKGLIGMLGNNKFD